MCTPDLRYKTISIVDDVLTFNGGGLEIANKKTVADADFDLLLTKIRNGGNYRLAIKKTIPGDIVITTDEADMVFGEGLGASITLSGADETLYLLEITNDGTQNCIKPLGAAVDLSGLATESYVDSAVGTKLDKLVTIQRKDNTVTNYQLQTTDNATIICFEAAVAITVELPNDMPLGFNVGIIQDGAGQITFNAEAGATLHNRQSHTKTAGQRASVSLLVDENAGGASAIYNMAGDTAA